MAYFGEATSDLLPSRHWSASVSRPGAEPQFNMRSDLRQRTYLGGMMITSNGVVFNCIIRNLSATGAMIQTLANPSVPDTWRLVDIKNGIGFQVTTAWRETPRAGVRFADKVDLTKDVPQSWQHIKALWSSVARSNPVAEDRTRAKARLRYMVS